MIVFRKARTSRQTLNDLDAYLKTVGEEPVRWLAREVQSWGEFSYSELENLIMTGGLNDLIDWQARWAEVINQRLALQWQSAMEAASKKATKGKVILDDSDVDVKNYLRTRGGELITVLSAESKRAVAMVILRGQAEKVLPKKIAQQIRPLIGLNERQAQANMTYRERVYQNLLASGLPPVTAAARADKVALRYAGKQHRERADMIVNTELAFAYNRGADIGVRRAIKEGYMGRCEMVWTTAGTNRVCPRCLALKDTVVGHTDESGVLIPPLHPRCRCAIMYREVGIANNPTANGILKPTNTTGISGENKPLTPQQIKTIRDAEETAFKAKTGADFDFKKMKGTPDWAKEIILANGDGKGIERMINCQRCVIAHEARMRGYDVIARPSWGVDDPLQKVGNWLGAFEESSREIYNCVGKTGKELEEFIATRMAEWGKDSRAFVWFKWEGATRCDDFGHVIVTRLNENDFVQYGDPQKRKIAVIKYLSEIQFGSVVIMRADTLKFTDVVKRCCMNRRQTK